MLFYRFRSWNEKFKYLADYGSWQPQVRLIYEMIQWYEHYDTDDEV